VLFSVLTAAMDTTGVKIVKIREKGACDFCGDTAWYDTVRSFWIIGNLYHSDKWNLPMSDYRVRVIERSK